MCSCLGKLLYTCAISISLWMSRCVCVHACNEGSLLTWPLKHSRRDSLSFFSSHSISAQALPVQSSPLSLSLVSLPLSPSFFSSNSSSVILPVHLPSTLFHLHSINPLLLPLYRSLLLTFNSLYFSLLCSLMPVEPLPVCLSGYE